jgi:small ligand-binding sensory domain FIST
MYLGGPVRQPDTRAKGAAVVGGKMGGGGSSGHTFLGSNNFVAKYPSCLGIKI